MTSEEHKLVFLLFFKQRQTIRILLDMLKSRDILTDDDEEAFSSAQLQNVGSNAAVFDEAKAAYLVMAQSLGIQTGLDRLPELPLDSFQPPTS